jgi:hypothetical protein
MKPMRRPSRKPKLTEAQCAARFAAEKARLERHYCDAFAGWRDCRVRRCRRDGACRGDATACLKRALETVPRAVQWQARQDILTATAANIGAPERAARQLMPRDFYDARTVPGAVAKEAAFR